MSILIRGMKMPKNCEACDLCYDYVYCMAASNVFKINFETRPKECPLVEVPAPHGRLIDADRFEDDLIKEKTRLVYLSDHSRDFNYMEQAFVVNNAILFLSETQQTIIEAEGEKEDG